MPPKERVVYGLLISVFLFGAGYVGAQRFRQPPKIELSFPKDSNKSSIFSTHNSIESSASSTAPTVSPGTELVVHVVGAVKTPGIEHLPAGSRIDDAVKAAGGPTLEANTEAINLAAKLEDGQQVVVPKKGQDAEPTPTSTPSAGKGGKHPIHPIDLNASSYAQLEELPGVGPSMAEKLMDYRLKNGHLSFQDLRAIPGLGPKKLEKIRPWVRD